jgi:hypothetical protein
MSLSFVLQIRVKEKIEITTVSSLGDIKVAFVKIQIVSDLRWLDKIIFDNMMV